MLAAGVLDTGDPYFDLNELRYRWVALSDWVYTLTLPRKSWIQGLGYETSRGQGLGVGARRGGGIGVVVAHVVDE